MKSIHPNAKIGEGNDFSIGTIIGPYAEIGNNNIIGSYVNISDNVTIGDGNIIHEYTSISGNVTIGNGNGIGVGDVFGGVANYAIRKTQNVPNVTINQEINIVIGDVVD